MIHSLVRGSDQSFDSAFVICLERVTKLSKIHISLCIHAIIGLKFNTPRQGKNKKRKTKID